MSSKKPKEAPIDLLEQMKSVQIKISYPGLQIYSPNQYIEYIRPIVIPVRWRVIKLKKAKFEYAHYPVVATAILWAVYGIYYAFIVYPEQFSCIVLLLILGFMCSFMFDEK